MNEKEEIARLEYETARKALTRKIIKIGILKEKLLNELFLADLFVHDSLDEVKAHLTDAYIYAAEFENNSGGLESEVISVMELHRNIQKEIECQK